MTHRLTLCHTCAAGHELAEALKDLPYTVTTTECMSGCKRPSTASFRAPGKTAYLFGDLTLDDLPDLRRFADLYAESTDGNFPDARILGALRLKAIARIPG
jgi:predicted metal-binding protein